MDNQEVENNILSSVVDKALISCHFPFNCAQFQLLEVVLDNQEVEKNILSSVVDKALISCHFPCNCAQLSAAGGDDGQPRGGEEYPELSGGQGFNLMSLSL